MGRMLVHALISNCVDTAIAFSTASLRCICVCSSPCWMPIHSWLSESGSSTTLHQLYVTTFTGFLLTSESSSNYACLRSNVSTRWHHDTMCVQLSADTRSRHLRSAARNELLIPRTRTASYGPRSFAVSGRRAGIVCRRNWSLIHWHCSSSSTDSKLYCFFFRRSNAWALSSWLCY